MLERFGEKFDIVRTICKLHVGSRLGNVNVGIELKNYLPSLESLEGSTGLL